MSTSGGSSDAKLTAPLVLPVTPTDPITIEGGNLSIAESGQVNSVAGFTGTGFGIGGDTTSLSYQRVISGGSLTTTPTALAQPALPASGVAYSHGVIDLMVFVAGGVVTEIAINGVATGLTSGSFYLPSNASITITYSTAPTWMLIKV